MKNFTWSRLFRKSNKPAKGGDQRARWLGAPRQLRVEQLEDRTVPSGNNPNEIVNTGLTPEELAATLVGPGVSVSNVTFTGGTASAGSFNFTDPTVVGFSQGIVLSSGSAADVVGPNLSDSTSTPFYLDGDTDLDALSGFTTRDAAVLEFDFIPNANQVVFTYAFASDEYPEWVRTDFNDVFAFFVNGKNYAEVRQVAGDPASLFVPVAVDNINNGNPLYPEFVPMRPDLFRANYYTAAADGTPLPSSIDLELDGITRVLTFQAPVNPGVINHMKLAIADATDWVYDSAVFIRADSLVSNENPVADLSLSPSSGSAPLKVTAFIEGEDPNGLPLTYTINWGDGTTSSGSLLEPTNESEKTATVDHIYTAGGTYIVTLTVSNGTLSGTSTEDVDVHSVGNSSPVVTSQPVDQTAEDHAVFTFSASASGTPIPSVQWQVSTDAGVSFTDIPGATDASYSATASLADNANWYRAVFSNSVGSATTDPAILTVNPAAPGVSLTLDSGYSSTDKLTNVGALTLTGVATGATVEYSTDGGTHWSTSFTAAEGVNSVLVRQSVSGNLSNNTALTFTLDTVPPGLSPTFSQVQPFLVNAAGITVAANATDLSGVYSESAGPVVTSIAGLKYVTVTATDNAGNVASTTVPYIVGYQIINLSPADGATVKSTGPIQVSFQLADANGVISDQAAANLLSNITVAFGGLAPESVKYNKKTNTFSANLKTAKPTPGIYDVLIFVTVDGVHVGESKIHVTVA